MRAQRRGRIARVIIQARAAFRSSRCSENAITLSDDGTGAGGSDSPVSGRTATMAAKSPAKSGATLVGDLAPIFSAWSAALPKASVALSLRVSVRCVVAGPLIDLIEERRSHGLVQASGGFCSLWRGERLVLGGTGPRSPSDLSLFLLLGLAYSLSRAPPRAQKPGPEREGPRRWV